MGKNNFVWNQEHWTTEVLTGDVKYILHRGPQKVHFDLKLAE